MTWWNMLPFFIVGRDIHKRGDPCFPTNYNNTLQQENYFVENYRGHACLYFKCFRGGHTMIQYHIDGVCAHNGSA